MKICLVGLFSLPIFYLYNVSSQSLGQGCIASNGQMEAVPCVVWAQLASLVQKSIVEINKLDIHVGASQLAIGLIEGLNLSLLRT